MNMKRMVKAVTVAALVALTVVVSGPASAGPKSVKVKLPATFACKHCKMKLSVKKAADWKSTCNVCPCKQTKAACFPGDKPKGK
jgi:hypothetical protein